ncbi:citrate/2-methylcitrate synthase [Engelhardtia mirabilis]|uniref:Citrate synthase n=1 Tax=Engelhardtia mirabilis TaxID=2528011 RepID=A0A518BLU0_9BACT|nr:Citrate synthase [Planctomycetes bacterium Pla133]QDV02268.1 Citrate synthase [Planctomycetes bacterium Pla86]
MAQKELVPGLAGVPAAESAISYIDGAAGILQYRGYRIEELAVESTFEETAWLLMEGELPTAAQLESFRKELGQHRELPSPLVSMLHDMPKDAHPMAVLQAAVAALGACEPRVPFGDEAAFRGAWLRLLSAVPSIVATHERFRRGQDPISPDPTLSTAGNFLLQLTGDRPSKIAERILDCALVLHADHTMNASTFAARVVYGTQADPYASICGGVGALSGPLHGGANERVLASLQSIGSVEAVDAWAQDQFANKGKIMGFGHRVYSVKDPRSHALQSLAVKLFDELGSTPIYDVALKLEQVVVDRLGDKGIHPNVDFFSGIVYSKLGIPTDQFTPIFAIARTAGWMAHLHEQMQDNKLYRPGQVYVGVAERPYVPIGERG